MAAEELNLESQLQATGRRLKSARAPVPLEPLVGRLQKVTGGIGNIFRLMKRIMLLVLQRVAAAFHVRLEHRGLNDEHAPAEAAFTGDPDIGDQVAAAAQEARRELSQFVQEVLSDTAPSASERLKQVHQAGGAPAYLSLALDELAAEMQRLREHIESQDGAIRAKLAEVAGRQKVDAGSLRELLVASRLAPLALLTAPADPAISELASELGGLEDAKQRLVQLQLSYCDHCVAAHQIDAAGELGSVAKRKAQELADPSLLDAVQMALAHLHNGKTDASNLDTGRDETHLNSGQPPGKAARGEEAASGAPRAKGGFRARAYFVGASGGDLFPDGSTQQEVDEDFEPGNQADRQRQ